MQGVPLALYDKEGLLALLEMVLQTPALLDLAVGRCRLGVVVAVVGLVVGQPAASACLFSVVTVS